MFQNLAENIITKYKNIKENDELNSKNRVLILQNILVYIIVFLISTVQIKSSVTPFAMAIFVACCNSNIPAGIILVITTIGSIIGFGFNGALIYVLNVLVFMVSILFIKPVIQDNRNEITRLGRNLIISTSIVQIVKCIIKKELFVYDILISVSSVILTYVFYKIFVNSISVIKNINKEKTFSIEEIIGATIVISISTVALNPISFLGLSISNIVAIFMILALSYRSGTLVGGTTGISVGLILGILGICTPMQILAYAIAGLFSGILSRLGKIFTILGFVSGCVIIAYISTGLSVEIISFKEIIVSCIAFMFVPKFVGIDIVGIMDDVKMLEWKNETRLAETNDTKNKLDNISDIVSEMSKVLGVNDKKLIEQEIDNINNSKVTFVEDLLDNIDKFPNNILYDDISELKTGIIEDIYITLIDKS